ncbi:hypothetical protein CKA55_07350 [Arcobacter suis]|uniref:ParB-like N-terminal domain-containing protein n=1 Tax=Arcobacter suis CECT 7833 TaxID=663365 RepID=A0AAD0WQ36_9BACT|nr:ParB/RepB/Spo0J family partition protein [Arcobacter suis]AXX89311.1 hypothetical protein ASUIS_0820 [Arcobacter suis CECT 7833]RWS46545.1 hypothetical protein CKA55_07350 [Arcobacter suis]
MLSNLDKITAGKVRTSGITAFNELVITKVYPNPNQPRKQFDDIEELAANIKEHGLLQPITVVKKDDGYMIVSGERRYKAHLHNEAKTIMALILTSSDEQVEELTLIENIQRSDLTDFEVAKYICKLWDSGRYAKKSDLANRIGKKDSFVSKAFGSLKLDTEILKDIEEKKINIPISVMDEIARVGDADTQKKVYEKYNNKEITRDEIKDFKEPISLKSEYFGAFKFICHYFTKVNLDILLGGKPPFHSLNLNKTYHCIIEKVNREQERIQSNDELRFTLKTGKKELESLKELGDDWIKISNNLLENKIYRFWIELSTVQEEIKKEPINHTLERFEDADNDLVEQAKSFTKNFPRKKSFSEQLDEANKLENKFTQLINDGYRDYNSEIKINNEYERIIYRLILQKSPKEVDNKVNKINACISNKDGYTQKLSAERIFLSSDGCSITLDNRYDEIIFNLSKENLELRKEIEELKQNKPTPKEKAPLKDDEPKEIKLLELNENDVYIEYMDNESEHISYNKAKTLIKNSKKEYIKYENTGSEKACNFLNTLPKDILKTGGYLKKQYKF